MLYTTHPSPLGDLLIAGPEPGVLGSISFPGQKYAPSIGADWRPDATAFTEATRQLDAYYAGELKEFTLSYAVAGSEFRMSVWEAIDRIPYGATVTYGELAAMAGAGPRAVRAVGGAVGRNPLTVVRPCHRIIGADGSLTGYAGGMERKRRLLSLEGVLQQPELV
jgi:methylated-DNA-[protein]-cysteine S-methyltransferase